MKRPEINVQIESSFLMKKMEFNEQYGAIYFNRLKRLYPLLEETIKRNHHEKGDKIEIVEKLSHIPEGRIALIGTIFKKSQKVPSLLKQYQTNKNVSSIDFKEETYLDEKDTAYIEDSTGHIGIIMEKNQMDQIASGTVLALIGEIKDDNMFFVEQIHFPYEEPTKTILVEGDTKSYIALVNDISFSNRKEDLLLHNILANELSFPTIGYAFLIGKHVNELSLINQYDHFLTSICNTLNIVLIPSRNDPTNAVYPYQPIHPSIFSKASSKSTYHSTTNPAILTINETKILIISGDIISHHMKMTSLTTPIDVMIQLLQCGHLCPSSPSTFPCFPASEDPFIFESPFPDVIIIGGFDEHCESFLFMNKPLTIVTVPSFNEKKTIVLFDLENKLIKPITLTLSQ